ncbi:MAG: glycolate oxidase subunit GlcE [Rhodospirillales bacterium]|nr:glycolate oxidase subunit GlcE [Rhodospirillales bacterium]
MSTPLDPATVDDLRDVIRWAVAGNGDFEIAAGGTKRDFGRPVTAAYQLDLGKISGIGLYEPTELVLSAKAATPLSVIEEALMDEGQRLEFEPPDWSALLGTSPERATLGGVIACNLAGPRRIKAGAARDHVLGFEAVSGRGEVFKAGGRVVKNVTGFDLSKLMAGSFGTLAVMADITVKVMPMPETTATLTIVGLDGPTAVQAMTAALGSPNDVSAAAHLPADVARHSVVAAADGDAVTALRLEGLAVSVQARQAELERSLAGFGELGRLGPEESDSLWREVRDATPFAVVPDEQIWRLSVAPRSGAEVATAIGAEIGGRYFLDWGGGLVWLAIAPRPDAAHNEIRRAVDAAGGHATLIRASTEIRAQVPVFHPESAALAQLSARVKDAFDPRRVLNRGRMRPDL